MIRFADIEIGQEFSTEKGEPSYLVWKKLSKRQAVVVKAVGKYLPRWLDVIDNVDHMKRVFPV